MIVVLVSEGGIHRRMSKREAFFKMFVTGGPKDPRFATLLMKFMEQYDLVRDEQTEECIRIVLVRLDGREHKINDRSVEKS